MKISLHHIHDMARHRPPGYEQDVLSHGTISGDQLHLPEGAYAILCRKYRPSMPPFGEMIENFTESMKGWVAAGFPVVSNDTFTDRLDTCRKCEFWVASPFGNRCSRCGCTQIKLWLKTEKCPVGKWE